MVVITRYTLIYNAEKDGYMVMGCEAVSCPDCGNSLLGYDRRPRRAIASDGQRRTYLLRRLRCRGCGKIHQEIPDFILPHKHYTAEVISDVRQGNDSICPADDSTIRRWRK